MRPGSTEAMMLTTWLMASENTPSFCCTSVRSSVMPSIRVVATLWPMAWMSEGWKPSARASVTAFTIVAAFLDMVCAAGSSSL